jgi:hypothetical protein
MLKGKFLFLFTHKINVILYSKTCSSTDIRACLCMVVKIRLSVNQLLLISRAMSVAC